jgi:DNA-binding protein HU-beta
VTLAELIRRSAKDSRATKIHTAKLLRVVATIVAEAVRRGETVRIPGFGTFYPARRKSRRIAGPPGSAIAGEVITLPSTETIGFRAAKAQRRQGARQ